MITKKKFDLSSLNDYGPIIQVKLKSTQKNANIDYYNDIKERYVVIHALIDTGATHSIIDLTVLTEDIEIEKMKFTDRQLFIHGSSESLPVYKVGLDLLQNDNCVDVFVAAKDLSVFKVPKLSLKMLIGRDILSKCIFTYNGLGNSLTIDYKIDN